MGRWQFDRLTERRATNATLTARTSLPVVPLSLLLDTAVFRAEQVAAAAYRRVTVTGRYLTDEEVILISRPRNTLAGHHLLTPVETADGYAVVVDRGWVPFRTYEPPVPEALPPGGEVTVTGVLFPSQERKRFGPRDPPGELDEIWRIDLDRLAEQIERPVAPLWLLFESQQPPQASELPKSIELPSLDEGPHKSYALQWFAFTVILLAGYAAVVRKKLVSDARRDRVDRREVEEVR